MGLDESFPRAFAKSQLGSGTVIPESGTVFISVKNGDKAAMVELGQQLVKLGFEIIATRGTAEELTRAGVVTNVAKKVREGRPHIVDVMISGGIDLIFNTTEGAYAIADSFTLRQTALYYRIPYYTTVAGCRAVVSAISALKTRSLDVAPLQSYFIISY